MLSFFAPRSKSFYSGLFLSCLVLSGQSLFGCVVRGTIVDAESMQPLSGANISFINEQIGTTTDVTGRFEIDVPDDSGSIQVRFIGYKDQIRFFQCIAGSDTLELMFSLEPTVLPGKEIGVSARSAQPVNPSFHLDARTIEQMPAPTPDLLQSLKTLPGIVSAHEQSSTYSVHGGGLDENAIFINGFELMLPHMSRKAVAEMPSPVNPDLTESMYFYPGTFPVYLGNKLSSVLDIHYKTDQQTSVHSRAGLSMNGGRFSIAFRPGSTIFLAVAGRRLNYRHLFSSLQIEGDYSPEFSDLQFTGQIKPAASWHVRWLGILADYTFSLAPDSWEYFRYDKGYLRSVIDGGEHYRAQNRIFAVSTGVQVLKRLSFDWTLASSFLRESENSDVSQTVLYSSDFRAAPTENDYDAKTERREDVSGRLRADYLTSRLTITSEWKRLSFKAGLYFKSMQVSNHFRQRYSETMQGEELLPVPYLNMDFAGEHRGRIFSSFFSTRCNLSKALGTEGGIRWVYSTLSREPLILPRIALTYDADAETRLTIAAGRYAQPPLYKELEGMPDDRTLLAQKAMRFRGEIERKINDKLSLKVAGHFQRISDLIPYELLDVRVIYAGHNQAEGYHYGVDVFLKGQFSTDTENWISYSYLLSREDLEGDANGYVPRPLDRTHHLAVYMEDRMERFPASRLFVRFIYGSGLPFTFKTWVYDSVQETHVYRSGERAAMRLPAYARFDIGFTQTFQVSPRLAITCREQVLNLFNHYNVLGHDYVFGHMIDYSLSGRLFNLSLDIEY